MKSFISIFKASFWFVLCVIAAFFLLGIALTYNGYMMLKKGLGLKKIEFPRFQITR